MATTDLSFNNFQYLKEYIDRRLLDYDNQIRTNLVTNNITSGNPNIDVFINSNITVTGQLNASSGINITEVHSITKDPNLFINSEYINPDSIRTGIVSIYNPTEVNTTFTQIYDNLTIITDLTDIFSEGDLIQLTNTNDNNGIYEVDTHIGNVLYLRGNGGNPLIETFTKGSLITETVNGLITKVNISHLSTGPSGEWQYASGSTTGFIYNTVGANTNLQDAYNNGQTITIDGATLNIRDSATPFGSNLFKITDNGDDTTFFAINANGIQTIGVNTGQGYNQVYPMNQPVRSTDMVVFDTVNTGQGNNKLYAMNQAVKTTDGVIFDTVNTGQGDNKLYPMNQPLRTTDTPVFTAIDTGNGPVELFLMDQNVRTNDNVIFNTVNTGQGANKLYSMNQNVRTTDNVSFTTINTGQGSNKLYAMDQNVRTIDTVTFNTINTGQGANKIYPMNQAVRTTDAVTFANVNTGQGATQIYPMNQPVRNTDSVIFNSIDTGFGATDVYPMNQPVRTTDDVVFNSINTGQGVTDVYLMNQNIRTNDNVMFNTIDTGLGPSEIYPMDQYVSTTSSPQFTGLKLNGITLDNTQSKVLVLDSVTNIVEYRDVSTLPSGNPFNQSLNTGDAVVFTTVDTGFGPTEIYPMDQALNTSSSPEFTGLTLSGITLDNTQGKLLVLNSITNDVEYRDINTLPNPFDQSLNTTSNVSFNTINTGQGPNELYGMDQNVRTIDNVAFNTVDTGQGPTEIHLMNQNMRTIDDVVFNQLILSTVLQDNTQSKVLVLDSVSNVIEYRDIGSFPNGNPFNQSLNTGDAVVFASVDTGFGPVELYPMDQALTTTSSPEFNGLTLTGITIDNTQGKLLVLDSISNVIEYRDVNTLPVVNPFNQTLNTGDAVTFTTVNTGQGDNKLYAMNQPVQTTNSPSFITLNLSGVVNDNVQNKILVLDSITNNIKFRDATSLPANNPFDQVLNTTSSVTFTTVNTGQGANELYAMNQNVRTTDTPTFTGAILNGVLNDNTQGKLLVLDSITNTIEYRDVNTLPTSNPFNQTLNTTDNVVFNSINTGQGVTDVYLMNQNVRSSDNVVFNGLTLNNILNDNNQNKILVLDNISNTVEYRTVASLPVVNPFDQTLNTGDAAVFATVNTGQGANELYAMNQNVRNVDTPEFISVVLSGVGLNNTQGKLLVLDSITNTIEYRDVNTLPVVNPFNQTLNTGDAVLFTTVDTGQGANELYPMNQAVRTTDSPTFVSATLTGVALDNTQSKLLVLDSSTNVVEYRDVNTLPVVNPFNQSLNTSDAATFITVDTGQGANELYPMNQPVRTTDSVTFSTINTGHGDNELYAMDQNVRSVDSPIFTTLTLNNILNDNTQSKLLVLDSITNVIEYRNVSTLPVVNPFNQTLNTGDAVVFATVNTGQGANELYPMNQAVRTTDSPTFVSATLSGVTLDNTQSKLLVLDSITNTIEYREVNTLPSGNPFNQTLNTGDAVVFTTVDTGQGANELYPMNQAVRTTDSPTFVSAALTGVALDNTQSKLLVLDSVTNVVEYRNVNTLPVVNPFNQTLNTSDAVVFDTVDTGQGATNIYPMNQAVRTIDSVTFTGLTLDNILLDNTQGKLLVLDSITNVVEYRDVNTLPVVNPFNQSLNTGDAVVFDTINTGLGPTDVYLMNQNVRTTDAVIFDTVNTGQGANELYPMNQAVRTTDSPTFVGATLTGVSLDNTQSKLLVLDSVTNTIEYRDVSSLPGGNPFDQTLNTGDAVVFTTVDTGQGANELYPMNQAVRTTDSPTFVSATLTGVTLDNTQNKLLVLDSVTNVVEYRDVSSLPGGNPFDQTLNTSDAVVFTTVNTGQGANELYPMDQPVRTTDAVIFATIDTGLGPTEVHLMNQNIRTTDSPTFVSATLTGVVLDNTQNKLLVLDSVTNTIEYRDVSSLPVVNTFNQTLNTGDAVVFATIDTGLGPTDVYLMNQNIRTTDSVVFATVDTGQGANELYPMDQPVRSTDAPIFTGATLTGVMLDNTQSKLLVLDSITNVIEYRDVSSLPGGNPFDQSLNTTDAVTFVSINTGQGANELYAMDQDVRTVDTPVFVSAILSGVVLDNTQGKLLVLDSITNIIEYRDVSSLPVVNPFNQTLNTGDAVVFTTVNTGQGANELYPMDQAVRSTDSPTFGSLILNTVANDDTQTKILVLDSVSNVIEYRDVNTLPSGNPFNQTLNTVDNVVFNTVNTGQGANKLYPMNQAVRTTDVVTFTGATLTGVLNDNTETRLLVLDITTNDIEYRDVSSLPNQFNQTLNTGDAVVFTTVDTGQGANELYPMDQAVRTTDAVVFATVDTGLGPTEVHLMNQNIRTTDAPTFTGLTLNTITLDNTQNKLLVLDSVTNVVEYRDVSSLPNPFNQTLNTGDAVVFATVDTGQGANELYPMDQAVRTTDSPTFMSATLTGVVLDNTQNKLLVLDSVTNTVEYRDVSSLPATNPFNQTLNTGDAVVFTTVDTGQGANELYPMDQAVRTTDVVTFVGATLTNILNDNTQNKILVLDSVTNVVEYRDAASLPGGNPFNQTLNTGDAVVFTTVDTGQGANELYPMDQSVRTTDVPQFISASLTGVLNDNTESKLLVLDSVTNVIEYRDVSTLPNPFDQTLNTGDAVVFTTVNTGQGANELYAMDQNVRTTDAVVFATVDTGLGPTEIHLMNQNIRTTDAPTFTGLTLSGITVDNIQTKLLVLDSITNAVEYRDVTSLPNQFDQSLNTTDAVAFATIDTGFGATDVYPMNQAVRTTDAPTFTGLILSGITVDNAQTKLLVLDSITNTVEYRDVTSLPNQFDQSLNTTDAVAFATIDTGFGATDVYPMNQAVRTTDAVVFATVNTGQGANELYAMDQAMRTTDTVTFNSVIIDSFMSITSTADSSLISHITPTIGGDKDFSFRSNTGTGATILAIENTSTSLTGHSQLNISTDVIGSSGAGGNQSIYFENAGAGGWTIGHQANTNTFRFNYDITTDNVVNNANTKFSITTTGDISCNTIDTGLGATDVYLMNQNVRTTDAVTHTGLTLTNILLDNTQGKLLVLNSVTNVVEYRDVSSLPNQFDQSLNTVDSVVFATVNTGQGANELYAMDQNVRTTDAVVFDTVDTGQGPNELYAMDQNVRTIDAVTFTTVNTGQGNNELYAMDQPVRTVDNVVFATVDTGQGPNELYAMNQNVRTTDAVVFTTVDTGQGPNELFPMDQAVRTTDAVVFATIDTGLGPTEVHLMNQNVRTTDAVVFATVDTGQGPNELYAMNQPVRTTDAVVFATVDTGQGPNELYAMNQPVRTTDSPTFVGATLTGVLLDNTQTKVLVLDSVTNVIEYRDASTIGVGGNPPVYGKLRSLTQTTVTITVQNVWVAVTMGNTWGTGSFNGFTGSAAGVLTRNAVAGTANVLYKFSCSIIYVGTTGSGRTYDFALFKNDVLIDDVGSIITVGTSSASTVATTILSGTFTSDLTNADAISVHVRCTTAAVSNVIINNIAFTIYQ